MTSTRLAAYVGGAMLLLAWLASASGVARQPQRARVPSRPADAAIFQSIASDVQSQASRLRKRMATAPAPQAGVRNPFAFRGRAPASVRRAVQPAPVAVAAAPEATVLEPSLALAGIAERATAAGPLRTAVITAGTDELFMVAEGQTLLSRYRVVAVGVDAVELLDGLTGLKRRLVLQQ